MVQAFVAHVATQDAAVSGEAGDGDAHVIVDFKYFTLVGRKFRWGSFESGQNGMRFVL